MEYIVKEYRQIYSTLSVLEFVTWQVKSSGVRQSKIPKGTILKFLKSEFSEEKSAESFFFH